ncbi:polyisoprenoid-binding protein YceI [Caulobacter ginsengisoli]|uniref:Polyisoprenoid-binding protein YceI n=1 Tax=Caulobacter ginsengisoli TaxID=400775 RepID=A0ABU0J069_9CAUL|nr:YceI family protein [Caulobacter ginsengisoli]MDQ0466679.1 polyisoprenoid-binding protein YceI [Caulobacter ginsengisoli]
MRRLAALALACSLIVGGTASAAPSTNPADMPAGQYVLDKEHASLIARVRHEGLAFYTVRLDKFDASFSYDPKAPEASKINVTVDAASLDNGNPKTSAEFARQFLDVDKNPTITFVSTAIARGEGNTGTMTGDLTFRGVTRPVTLDVTFGGYTSGILGQRAGFSARGKFKRSEFGSTYMLNPPLAFVDDEVELVIEAEFTKK